MRRLATMVVLSGLLAACSPETKPSASLDCHVAPAPSLDVIFGINTGGDAGHSWVLDYGDGQTSDSTAPVDAPSHTYERPGRYTARLMVTADDGTARDECVVTVPRG